MADCLPNDLLCFIGYKLDSTGDRIRFRAVSRSWRAALPFRQPPWLILSESKGTQPRGFVSVGEQTIREIDLPDIHGATVVGSEGNWLITMSHCENKIIRLVNPFSRRQFQLPSLHLSPDEVLKIVLSSCPSNNTDRACVAIAVYAHFNILAIARLGDTVWTTFVVRQYIPVEDVIFFKQEFYAIEAGGMLMVCSVDPEGLKPSKLSPPFACFDRERYLAEYSGDVTHYLVEWSGELLIVVRCVVRCLVGEEEECFVYAYKTVKFKIYKFDFANGKFEDLNSLGDYALFLGCNTSLAVAADRYFGLVRRNCIYFTDNYKDDYPVESDGGVYNLEDGSITPHFEGISTPFFPTIWIIPA